MCCDVKASLILSRESLNYTFEVAMDLDSDDEWSFNLRQVIQSSVKSIEDNRNVKIIHDIDVDVADCFLLLPPRC
jgi:hypothetical protein